MTRAKPKAQKPRRGASVTFEAWSLLLSDRFQSVLGAAYFDSPEAADTWRKFTGGGKVIPVTVTIWEMGRGK